MNKIPVLEIFGPTIQGEGMVIGRKTMFIRTAGCDYQCSWCDSAFTWNGSAKDEIKLMDPEEIAEQLFEIGGACFDHVTISGGNPALLAAIGGLVDLLKEKGIKTALETQGSRWQPWMLAIDDLTFSPKPPSSGMKTDFGKLDYIVNELKTSSHENQNMCMKVVIFDEEDLNYAIEIHKRYQGIPFYLQVGNDDTQTEDNTSLVQNLLTKYETLINMTLTNPDLNDVRVLPQIHTLLWGNKRGV